MDDLPGCAVRAGSREEVLERLPEAIRSFLAWAGVDAPAEIEVEVGAEVESAIEVDEDTEVLVAADRLPLTREHWQEIDRLLRKSRAELLERLESLRDDELAATRDEIEHIAFVELMYAMWTFDLKSKDGVSHFLAWTRQIAQERMNVLVGNDAVTSAEWAGAPRPEPWTARKAARRLLWHELLHLRRLESR